MSITYRQATKFSADLLNLRHRGPFYLDMAGITVRVIPEPKLTKLNLQFTDADLKTAVFNLELSRELSLPARV